MSFKDTMIKNFKFEL